MDSAYNMPLSTNSESINPLESSAVNQLSAFEQVDNIIESTDNNQQVENNIFELQETIITFFLEQVKIQTPSQLLQEFNNLWLVPLATNNQPINFALAAIIEINQIGFFEDLLCRICYILINNWKASRNYQYTKSLINLLEHLPELEETVTANQKQLRDWLNQFIKSNNFQQIKSLTERQNPQDKNKKNYLDTLAIDFECYRRQKLAEESATQKAKEKFRFDLAMYTARSQSPVVETTEEQNPTNLGNNVLNLIQKMLLKRGVFSHTNVANIFLKQTEGLSYQQFKDSLVKYLTFALDDPEISEQLRIKLASKLEPLYSEQDEKVWNYHLLLRTCNRLIEFFTTQNRKEPAPLFTFLTSQDKYLILALLLLKIILICRPCYVHLECCLANLSKHYQEDNEVDEQWLVNFLDTLRIALTVYADNVQYNLVNMEIRQSQEQGCDNFSAYRVFSQTKF